MSSSRDISTVLTKDHANDENKTESTRSILSVRLQASKFQRISHGDQQDIPSLINKSANLTAPTSDTYRSQSNQLRTSSNRNDNATLYTGSRKLDQMVLLPLNLGDTSEKFRNHSKFDDGCEMEAPIKEDTVEHDLSPDSCSSDDEDIQYNEDSADDLKIVKFNNNNDRPKPGRLDLRQFDNITSAIAKLNVNPQPTPPLKTPVNSLKAPKPTSSSLWRSNQSTDRKVAEFQVNVESEASAPSSRRPLQNPRKNHGRPVAPPRLPTNLVVSSSAPSSSMTGSSLAASTRIVKPIENQPPVAMSRKAVQAGRRSARGSSGDEAVIDFSQSPIAQRLLRHAEDQKGKCQSSN